MKEILGCSFCGKPQGRVSNLLLTRKGRSAASICDECLDVCRKILTKSGTEPITVSPKSYYRIASPTPERNQLICSFCGVSQEKARRLIGSPAGLPPAYICDKCVAGGSTAKKGGNRLSLGNWIARKLGRRDTTVHHIE
jgi:ATP-dependent protease Clp ATPase subunit